jgi:hypothetical protein
LVLKKINGIYKKIWCKLELNSKKLNKLNKYKYKNNQKGIKQRLCKYDEKTKFKQKI